MESDIEISIKESNKGNIIKSDLSNTLPINGAAIFYVWVEKDPLLLKGDKFSISISNGFDIGFSSMKYPSNSNST